MGILLGLITSDEKYEKINGVVINIRTHEALLSIWMKNMKSEEEKEKYRKWIRVSLGMTMETKIEYKEFPPASEVLKMQNEEKDKKKEPADKNSMEKVSPEKGQSAEELNKKIDEYAQ